MSQTSGQRSEIIGAERLTVGVAARLSRYLQVLTQARKMGKDSISSQEISEFTNVNATQIRRDLSGFGKFGKRGVGYNIDFLIAEIRKILRTSGQHNIALVGAGRLGHAIAESSVFADHGFNIAAVFDSDPSKLGGQIGRLTVQAPRRTSSSASWPCPPRPRRTPRTRSSPAGSRSSSTTRRRSSRRRRT
jgi:NADH/NAD ratio-sensing transcriptional regulator Rex